MAKFKVLNGIFGGKGAGETVELQPEHGAYYVAEGLLEELAVKDVKVVEVKPEPIKKATRKKADK